MHVSVGPVDVIVDTLDAPRVLGDLQQQAASIEDSRVCGIVALAWRKANKTVIGLGELRHSQPLV